MKAIYLIRHAKSDWNNSELSDFERPLNKRGLRDAPFMGGKLSELKFNPDLIICSPAQRTTSTAQLLCSKTNYSFEHIKFEPSIYESSLNNLIELINDLPNTANEVAMIGHNPSTTMLSNYLTDDYIGNMPTCSIVKIELEIEDWNEIVQGIGSQKYFIYPKAFS